MDTHSLQSKVLQYFIGGFVKISFFRHNWYPVDTPFSKRFVSKYDLSRK